MPGEGTPPVRQPAAVRTLAAVVLVIVAATLWRGDTTLDRVRFGLARLSGEPAGCPFRARYGIDCIGCGGTRAFKCVSRGRLGAAFRFNRWGALVGLMTWATAAAAALSLLTGRVRYLALTVCAAAVIIPIGLVVHSVLWWRALPPGFHFV